MSNYNKARKHMKDFEVLAKFTTRPLDILAVQEDSNYPNPVPKLR